MNQNVGVALVDCVSWKLGKKWRLYLVALYVVAEGTDGEY